MQKWSLVNFSMLHQWLLIDFKPTIHYWQYTGYSCDKKFDLHVYTGYISEKSRYFVISTGKNQTYDNNPNPWKHQSISLNFSQILVTTVLWQFDGVNVLIAQLSRTLKISEILSNISGFKNSEPMHLMCCLAV